MKTETFNRRFFISGPDDLRAKRDEAMDAIRQTADMIYGNGNTYMISSCESWDGEWEAELECVLVVKDSE